MNSKAAKQQQENLTKKSGLSTIPLNSRIQNVQVNIMMKLVYVVIYLSFLCFFLLGNFLLYKKHQLELDPAYELAMDYIQFYIKFENAISVALLIKSQQQIYNVMENVINEEKLILDKYDIEVNAANVLIEAYSFNHSDLNQIYQKIIDYDIINGEDETYILTLYNNDFCLIFDNNQIPFCNKSLTSQQFTTEFGLYESKDNNSQYLKSGIVGIVSKVDAFLLQYFEYEYQSGELDSDLIKLNQQLNSQDFNNIVIQHYLDIVVVLCQFYKIQKHFYDFFKFKNDNTYRGFEYFFNLIQESIINLITEQQNTQDLYQYLIGIFLVVFLIVSSVFMIIRVNLRLIHLRLLITLLPVEVMLDIYTAEMPHFIKIFLKFFASTLAFHLCFLKNTSPLVQFQIRSVTLIIYYQLLIFQFNPVVQYYYLFKLYSYSYKLLILSYTISLLKILQ